MNCVHITVGDVLTWRIVSPEDDLLVFSLATALDAQKNT